MKGVQRFGVKQKLAPQYVGPYQIIEKSGRVAYKIQLPPKMGAIFLVFHVSQLKKCLRMPKERVKIRGINIKSDLADEEKPVYILDHKDRVTQSRVIKFYKAIWSNHSERDATWKGRCRRDMVSSLLRGMPKVVDCRQRGAQATN
jgi:hypothetical protein